jgi:hypothetical protein
MTSAFHPSRLIGFDGPGLQILSREKLPYGITPVPKLLGAWKFVYPGDHSKDVSGHSAVPRFQDNRLFCLSGLALFVFVVNLAPAKNLLSSRNVLNARRQTFVLA